MNDTEKYLRKLFKPKENICYTEDVYGKQLVTLEAAVQFQPHQFVSINPLKDFRLDANVTEHRNFLIEFDKYAGTEIPIPLEEQHAMLADFDVPYTTLTFSGGKSLHAVICLSEPMAREEYDELAKLIRVVLWHSDSTQKNPSRLTRVAGATRGDVEQSLVDVRKRVSKERLVSWLSKFASHIERQLERERLAAEEREQILKLRRESGAFGYELLGDWTKAFLDGKATTKGSRHNALLASCHELFECGVSYEEAYELVAKAADLHGITADPRRAREAEQIVNYVYSGKRKVSF